MAAPAAAGTLSAAPDPRAFGTVSVSAAPAVSTVTITNTGSMTVLSGFTLSGTCGEFTANQPLMPVLLADGSTYDVAVTYDPVDRGGDSCTVTIVDDNADVDPFTLTGTGTAALLTVSGSPLGFANQRWNGGTPQSLNLTLTNNGNEAITAGNLALAFTTGTEFSAGSITFPIPGGGGSRTVAITFDPTAEGAKNDTLTFTLSNDLPGDSNPTATMSGTGTESRQTFTPSPLSCGTNGSGNLTIGNTAGTASLNISAMTITGANAGDFHFTDHGCTGQTCSPPSPGAIAVGNSTAFTIDCVPTASGARSATLNVTSDDPDGPSTVNLSCTGASVISTSPASTLGFGNQRVGTSSAFQLVTISNAAGAAPLSYAVSSSNPSEFAVSCPGGGPGCLSGTIAAGGSVSVRVTFSPQAAGARSGNFTITNNDPDDNPKVVALTGTGTISLLSVASPLAFGNVPIADLGGSTQSLPLVNNGTASLNVSQMTISGDASFSFAFGSCTSGTTCNTPISLAASGGTTSITLRCDPSTTGGKAGNLTITSDDPNSPAIVALTCNGTVPDVSVDPTTLAFGDQRINTNSTPRSFTVSNAMGAAVAPLGYAVSESSPHLSITCSPSCSGTLAAGASATIDVTFRPTTTGPINATVTVSTPTDPDEPSTAVAVSGNGVQPLISRTAPASLPLALGATLVGVPTAAGTVSVSNVGTGALLITSVTLIGANPTQFAITSGATASQMLNPAQGASWTVTCTPTSRGNKSATLRIDNDSDDNPATTGVDESLPLDVPLTCTGQQAELITSTSSINFGGVAIATTSTVTITVTNIGNLATTITGLPTTNSAFVASPALGNLPVPMAAGASVSVEVDFSPTNGNIQNGTLTIENGGATQPQVTLTGDGQTTGMDVTPDPVVFGNVRLDTPQTTMVAIQNNGEASLTVQSVTVNNVADFAITGITTPVVVGAGGSRTFQVRAQPTMLGLRSGTVTVQTNLFPARQVAVSAVGVAPDLAIQTIDGNADDGSFAFGGVDVDQGAAVGTIVISNTGTATLNVTSCNVTGSPVFARSATTSCPFAVAPGASANAEITFDPAAEAMATGTLTLVTDDGTIAIPLSGIGLDRHIALSTLSLGFPDTYRYPIDAEVMAVTITNIPQPGFEPGAPLQLSMVTTSGAGFSLVGPSVITVPGGGSVDVEVAFAPTTATTATGTLTIINDDNAMPMAQVALSGRGISRMVSMQPDMTIDLGRVAAGVPIRLSELDGAVVVVNQSSDAFTIRRLVVVDATGQPVTDGPFRVVGETQDLALAGDATVSIDVELLAPAAGSFAATLQVFLDDDPEPHAMVQIIGEAVDLDVHGGGCNVASGAGVAWALLVAALLTRRRRIAVAAVALLVPVGLAHADEIDLGTFSPVPAVDPDLVQIEGAEVGRSGSWSLGVALNYARNPLQVDEYDASGARLMTETPVTGRLAAELGAAYALFDRLELGVRLPVLQQSGDQPMLRGLTAAEGMAIGDLSMHARVNVVARRGFAAALSGMVIAPTATEGQYAGAGKLAGHVRAIIGGRSRRVTGALNAGVLVRERSQFGNLEQGTEMTFGGGAALSLTPQLQVIGEMFGNAGRDSAAAEWSAGLRFRPFSPLSISAGFGMGMVDGVGAADGRGYLTLAFSPGARRSALPAGASRGDDDGDRFANSRDECPAEPEDYDGFKDEDGCPDLDDDNDGIGDVEDHCPREAEDKDQFEDSDGCPDGDNDADGIADGSDKCLDVPEDRDGYNDGDGCPEPDNDEDGIVDGIDRCPGEAETINGNADDDGCPDPGDGQVMPMTDRLELFEPVRFSGEAKINKKSFGLLGQIAGHLRARPAIKRVRITAHVNARGANDEELSQKRADAVRDWLVQWGIDGARLDARGLGSAKPLVNPRQRGADQINDRIEFIIMERE